MILSITSSSPVVSFYNPFADMGSSAAVAAPENLRLFMPGETLQSLEAATQASLATLPEIPRILTARRTRSSRPNSMTQTRSYTTSNTFMYLTIPGFHRRFLLRTYPDKMWQSPFYEDAKKDRNRECGLCFEELFTEGEQNNTIVDENDWVSITKCCFITHKTCLDEWLARGNGAPCCHGNDKIFSISKKLGYRYANLKDSF